MFSELAFLFLRRCCFGLWHGCKFHCFYNLTVILYRLHHLVLHLMRDLIISNVDDGHVGDDCSKNNALRNFCERSAQIRTISTSSMSGLRNVMRALRHSMSTVGILATGTSRSLIKFCMSSTLQPGQPWSLLKRRTPCTFESNLPMRTPYGLPFASTSVAAPGGSIFVDQHRYLSMSSRNNSAGFAFSSSLSLND